MTKDGSIGKRTENGSTYVGIVANRNLIPCLGHECGNPLDGYDYECDYEKSGGFGCGDCICNGGSKDPRTGKRLYQKKNKKYWEGRGKCVWAVSIDQ